MYREQIKVLDCTIRDGGLINNHYFTDDFVRAVYLALSRGGVDYMEFGYRSSRELFPPEDYGAWKYCDDDSISKDGRQRQIRRVLRKNAPAPGVGVDPILLLHVFSGG